MRGGEKSGWERKKKKVGFWKIIILQLKKKEKKKRKQGENLFWSNVVYYDTFLPKKMEIFFVDFSCQVWNFKSKKEEVQFENPKFLLRSCNVISQPFFTTPYQFLKKIQYWNVPIYKVSSSGCQNLNSDTIAYIEYWRDK